jgi:mono/diheme cytochrome c family protein
MNKPALYLAAVVGLGTMATVGWITSDGRKASGSILLKPENPRVVALGKMFYDEHCASCHGANLEGEVETWQSPGPNGLMPAPPHDETGHTWHHRDELLFRITKFGVARAANLKDYQSAMPAYEGILTDEQIIAVLSFIKSTWPERVRKSHDEMNTRYQK